MESCAEVKLGNPHPRAELRIKRPEAEPESCTELVPGVKLRSLTTPVEMADPGVGNWEGTGSAGHRSIRQWSTPGSGMDWAAYVGSMMTQVAGSCSRTDVTADSGSKTDVVAASGSIIGVSSSIWSVAGVGAGSGSGSRSWVCGRHGAHVLLLLCLSDGQRGTAVQEHPLHII